MNKILTNEVKELYSELLDEINYIYDEFGYKDFSRQKYNEIVLKILSSQQLKQTKKELLYIIFEKVLTNELEKIRKNNMVKMYKYITNSIDLYSDSLEELIKFCLYITANNIQIDESKVVELLKNSNKFNKLLTTIFEEYDELIINEQFNIISTNATALFIIDVYCMLNNINYQIEDFEIEEQDMGNYDDNFKIFMKEISEYYTLNDSEVSILKDKILKGDKVARKKFINSNLKLVVNVALKYQNRGLELLDLIQEGSIGLMRSIETFDPNLGFKFSTYAVRGIKTAMFRAIENTSRNIRIPANLNYKICNYLKTINEFNVINGRVPTIEELEQLTGITKEKLAQLQEYSMDTISYNTLITNGFDTEVEMLELIPSDEESLDDIIVRKDLNERLKKMFKEIKLKEREIEIITLHFGLDGNPPMSQIEIGKKYKISRERIRQIIEKALKKIRESNKVYSFSNYMDDPQAVKENIKLYRKEYKKAKSPNKKVKIN